MAAFEKVGEKIEEAQKEFDTLRTTRRKQLEKPLNRIEKLKEEVSGVGRVDTQTEE